MYFNLRDMNALECFVVFDATDRSLALIRGPPENSWPPTPLPVRRDVGYELLFMARRLVHSPPGEAWNPEHEDVLYVWTPPPPPATRECDDDGWWREHGLRLPDAAGAYIFVEAVFTFQGKAFFVDLDKGLLYCDLPLPGAGDDDDAVSSVVRFDFTPLPPEIPPEARWASNLPEDMGPMNIDRAARCCAGNVVRFVCIHRPGGTYGPEAEANVSVWTLHDDDDDDDDAASTSSNKKKKVWSKDGEFRAEDVWKRCEYKCRWLPPTAPKCPAVMPDGTVCLRLPNLRRQRTDPVEDYVCCLDVRGGMVKFGWSARLDEELR
ncbi:hypothetical protein QOZ80_3BG0258810 [Eleusine coracana subsp. coracana]|nr:hypothetical protein QOZ80_3BG0258810 [Eleusine coracana subsp. coracana]